MAAIRCPFEKGYNAFSKWIWVQNGIVERFAEKIDSHIGGKKEKTISKENPPDEGGMFTSKMSDSSQINFFNFLWK